jgi:hypothetical protein
MIMRKIGEVAGETRNIVDHEHSRCRAIRVQQCNLSREVVFHRCSMRLTTT